MSAIALLNGKAKPTDADVEIAMDGNVCRWPSGQSLFKSMRSRLWQQGKATVNAAHYRGAPARIIRTRLANGHQF
jgi:hypothetical protein